MSEQGTRPKDPNSTSGTAQVPYEQPKDPVEPDDSEKHRPMRKSSRIPPDSIFYKWVVPALLVGMALVMLILILVAIGVLVGLVPFQ